MKHEEEYWKPIIGWEGLYEVSSLGRVRSIDRIILGRDGIFQRRPGGLLSSHVQNAGYKVVHLRKPGMSCNRLIHRIVAEAFIPNPQSLRYVNHIDENKLNNTIGNLEWCTPKYNTNYGNAKRRMAASHLNNEKLSRSVVAIDKDGHKTTYPSANEAARMTGISLSSIVRCCNNVKYYRSAGGYLWNYA